MKQYMQWTNSSQKISYFCHHDAKTCTINHSTVQAIANKDHLFVVAVYWRRKQSKTVILYNFSFESCNIILLHNIASDVRHGVWSVSSQNVNHCSYRFNEQVLFVKIYEWIVIQSKHEELSIISGQCCNIRTLQNSSTVLHVPITRQT